MATASESGGKHPMRELRELRDQVRLKLHLAGMDARARWEKLESSLLGLERSLEGRGESALSGADRTLRELLDGVREFVAELIPGGDLAKTSVEDVMTRKVVSTKPSDRLHHAAQLLWDNDCGCLPVLDGEDRVIAVVTDRDLCMAAYTQGAPLTELSVERAMSRGVHTARRDEALAAALERMRRLKVRRLPVVDAERRLVGLVTLGAIARFAKEESRDHLPNAAQADVAQALAEICEPAGAPER